MDLVGSLVVFLVLWWLVLFMVLPFGIRRPDVHEAGHDPGAPLHPMMWRKAAITTAITLVLFLIVFFIAEFELLTLRDLALEP